MSRWHDLWRAITTSRLTVVLAVVIVAATLAVVERVMAHRYRINAQLGFELAPAVDTPAPASSTALRP